MLNASAKYYFPYLFSMLLLSKYAKCVYTLWSVLRLVILFQWSCYLFLGKYHQIILTTGASQYIYHLGGEPCLILLYFLTFLGYSCSFILPEELWGYFIEYCVRIMLQPYIILERINITTILSLLIQKHGMPFILSKSSFMSLWQSNTHMFHCLPTFLRRPCIAVMLGTFG